MHINDISKNTQQKKLYQVTIEKKHNHNTLMLLGPQMIEEFLTKNHNMYNIDKTIVILL